MILPLDNNGNLIVGEAFRAFDRWKAAHDPDGDLDVLTAAFAYSVWAETNSIAPYLDAAQSPQECAE